MKRQVNSFMHYMKDNNPVMKGWFKIFFLLVIAATYTLVMTLLGTGEMKPDENLGEVIKPLENNHSHMAILSIQVLEPYLTLMMMLLIIKGSKSFFWWGLAGGSMLMISQLLVGLLMGVIKGAIFITLNFITYLKWGSQPTGPLIIKRADWKVWSMIGGILVIVTVVPGYILSPTANLAGEMTVGEDYLSYMDSLAFSLSVAMAVLNIGKYREARLMQLFNQVVTPVLFFMSGQYIYGVAGALFVGVTIAGASDWYIRARKTPEEQLLDEMDEVRPSKAILKYNNMWDAQRGTTINHHLLKERIKENSQ